MINPFYFTNSDLQIGFNIKLDSHNINHANSLLTITSIYPDFGTKTRYINKS